MPRDGGNRHGGIALAQDVLVLTQAQDERNVLALQIGHPGITDELAVAHQCRDLHVRKCRAQPIKKLGPLRRVRVSSRWQQHPQQRNAHAVPCYRDHQDVDRGLAKIPVRPIDRQNPWLAAEPQQFDNHARRQRTVEPDELKETVKPPPHRIGLRHACHIRRQPPQADCSMLHDQQRQPRQRLASCDRQVDVFCYRPG